MGKQPGTPLAGPYAVTVMLAVIGMALTLVVKWPFMLYSSMAAWSAAVIALCIAIARMMRALLSDRESMKHTPKRRLLGALLVGVVAVGSSTALLLKANAAGTRGVQSFISSVNLKTIGVAISKYAEEYGCYPHDLETLVDQEMVSPGNLISPYDPDAPYTPSHDIPYSSFVYMPLSKEMSPSGEHVIAHAGMVMGAMEPTIFTPYGRWCFSATGVLKLSPGMILRRRWPGIGS